MVSNWELFSLSGKFTSVIQFMSLVFELHIKWVPDITKYKKTFRNNTGSPLQRVRKEDLS